VARKRSEGKPNAKNRKAMKHLSDEDWAKLEARVARLSPRTGLQKLRAEGGRPIDRAARAIVAKAKS
jgi:cytochrome c553